MPETEAVWCCSQCGAIYHKDFPRCPVDGAEVVLAMEDPLLGAEIGHYIVDRLIGEGGMGRVYAAHHAHLPDKHYAIKVLLGDLAATATMRIRFTHEAESASRLSHPNLVNVIDFGCMKGRLYIVMELVTGESLTDLIEKGPMEPARVIRFARAICEGLVYAHEAGVVHRDLKPDNVLVATTPAGEELPRIADFGLCMSTDPHDARLTSTGMAMGTPAYSAPEQMAGKRVDHRADLYALGMTMFEMLTGGDLPFDGLPMEIMSAKAHLDPPPISKIAPQLSVPPGLEALISKLVKRKPAERHASAREVIAALDEIVLGLALDERAATVVESRREPSPTMPTRVPQGRRRWLAPLLAGLGGLAIVVIGVDVWLASRHPRTEPASEPMAIAPKALPPAPPPVTAFAAPEPASEPEIEIEPSPAASPPMRQPVHQRAHHPQPLREARVVTEPAPPTRVAEPPPPAEPPPADVRAPVVVPATPIAQPALEARVSAVDVSGSLSSAVVRRAIDRVLPAIDRCTPSGAPVTVQIKFGIAESRRSQNVRGSGAPAATIACLVGAFGGIRSEDAPDVGDTEVTVRIMFQVRR